MPSEATLAALEARGIDINSTQASTFIEAAPIKSPTVDTPVSFGQRESEKPLYPNMNPPFIYPGVRKFATLAVKQKVNRGYIRRLTEFYKNIDGAKTLQNLRCNFQFNPDLITRSVAANYDMQYFFNQDPDQLAQPIPGQAGFGFTLLFNREAEMTSGKYIDANGNLVAGNRLDGIGYEPDRYITEQYDPAWVTEIGVLADILILDDIVGQGLAKDVITAQAAGTLKIDTTESSTQDETDTEATDSTSDFDATKLSDFSANVGNKAYLVPTPVRIMLSEWFMVEGFVMNHKVTFNKFNANMIPTQAIVEVQVQALYIGFAQNKTFLTDINKEVPDDSGTGGTGGGGGASGSAAPDDVVKQTAEGTENYLSAAQHLMGSDNELDLLQAVFANPSNKQEFNIAALVSKEGENFYDNVFAKEKNGGGITFTFSGQIRIWWTQHVSNPTIARVTTPINAVTSGPIQYADGPPPKQGSHDFSLWGTKAKPFVLTCAELPVYYEQGDSKFDLDSRQFMVLGQKRGLKTAFNQLTVAGYRLPIRNPLGDGKQAFYTWERPSPAFPVPFREDKFTVELVITINGTRFGDTKPIQQTVRGYYANIKADDDLLWKKLYVSPAYVKGGPNANSSRGYGPLTQ
jgi:hypothetical protein